MLEAKPLTFLWKHWHCLKWGKTSLAVCRHQVPLHTIFSTKGFLANGTEPTHINSSGAECRLRKRKYVEHLHRISGHKIILFSSSTTPPYRHHHISIVFPPPPPPPHLYWFPSTSTTTGTITFPLFSSTTSATTIFLLFSLHHHNHVISIVFPPRDSIKDYQLPFLVHFVAMSRVVNNNRGFLQLLADRPAFSTATTCTSPSLIQYGCGTHSHPRRK